MKTNWNLSLIFRNDETAEKYSKELASNWDDFIRKYKTDKGYLTNVDDLKEALERLEQLIKKYPLRGGSYYYYYLKSCLDTENKKIKAKLAKLDEIIMDLSNDFHFFELDLGKVDKKTQVKFLSSPKLSHYKYWLKRLFELAQYQLSDKEEKIMRLKSNQSFGNWIDMIEELLVKQEREMLDENHKAKEYPFTYILSHISDRDKKVRDSAAKAFNSILKQYSEVAEYELNSVLEDHKVNDKIRNFKNPYDSRLVSEDITENMVESLREVVTSNFDISSDYYQLKSELFGVDKLKYHERNVPYGNINDDFSDKDAIDLVGDTFKELDSEFVDIFKDMVSEGQVDFYPKRGKREGAFCINQGVNSPTYVLLNFARKFNDLKTLAHEMGHAIHSVYYKKYASPYYADTSTTTAEISSVMMEDFVIEAVSEDLNDGEKLSILMSRLNDAISTSFRQIACYNFELSLHNLYRKKGYLSLDDIGELFHEHMKSYMGDYVDYPEESKLWWVYWEHIRMFFYVFSYASGYLVSKYVQKMIKEDPSFVEHVKSFMKMGSSDSPENILKEINIDITDKKIWEEGMSEVREMLNEAKSLAKKIGKI